MLFALGAVSTALDALQSLTAQKSSATPQTGFGQAATNPFSVDGSSGSTSSGATSSVNSGNGPQISPATMSALISAQSQSSASSTTFTATSTSTPTSRQAALKDLFSQIDADGDGKITKSEFENALGAGGTNLAQADSVFSKLDTNSDGSVSLEEMSKALKGAGHHHGHHTRSAGGAGDSGGGSDSSTQASGGSTSTSVTNSDGSTTTTIKYADGFKMSMTTPGASSSSSASGSGNSPYNWFEQMMQREAQSASNSTASSAVSVTA